LFKPYKSYKFKTRWVQLELFNSYLLSQNAIDFVIPTKEEPFPSSKWQSNCWY